MVGHAITGLGVLHVLIIDSEHALPIAIDVSEYIANDALQRLLESTVEFLELAVFDDEVFEF